jgi:hypothetical protein
MEVDWNTPTMNQSSPLTRDSFLWRQLPQWIQRTILDGRGTDAAIEDQKGLSVSGLFKARVDYTDRQIESTSGRLVLVWG